jgi:hypothetical protein
MNKSGATHSAPPGEHQQRRARRGHLNHCSTPVGCAGRSQDQETHSRYQTHPIEAAVVAGAMPRSIQIKHLARLVSNSGGLDVLRWEFAGCATAVGIKQTTYTFCQPSITVCSYGISVEALFGCHGVDGLAPVKHQQRARALAIPPITAAFGDVGQLLALCFSQNKGAGG